MACNRQYVETLFTCHSLLEANYAALEEAREQGMEAVERVRLEQQMAAQERTFQRMVDEEVERCWRESGGW